MPPVVSKNGEPFNAHCKPTPDFSHILPFTTRLSVKRKGGGGGENRKDHVARVSLQVPRMEFENLTDIFGS